MIETKIMFIINLFSISLCLWIAMYINTKYISSTLFNAKRFKLCG